MPKETKKEEILELIDKQIKELENLKNKIKNKNLGGI